MSRHARLDHDLVGRFAREPSRHQGQQSSELSDLVGRERGRRPLGEVGPHGANREQGHNGAGDGEHEHAATRQHAQNDKGADGGKQCADDARGNDGNGVDG